MDWSMLYKQIAAWPDDQPQRKHVEDHAASDAEGPAASGRQRSQQNITVGIAIDAMR